MNVSKTNTSSGEIHLALTVNKPTIITNLYCVLFSVLCKLKENHIG